MKRAKPIQLPVPRPNRNIKVVDEHVDKGEENYQQQQKQEREQAILNMQKLERNKYQLRSLRKNGGLPFSGPFDFTGRAKERRKVTKLMNRCMVRIGKEHIKHDDLKAPTGCPAASAYFTKSLFNM